MCLIKIANVVAVLRQAAHDKQKLDRLDSQVTVLTESGLWEPGAVLATNHALCSLPRLSGFVGRILKTQWTHHGPLSILWFLFTSERIPFLGGEIFGLIQSHTLHCGLRDDKRHSAMWTHGLCDGWGSINIFFFSPQSPAPAVVFFSLPFPFLSPWSGSHSHLLS